MTSLTAKEKKLSGLDHLRSLAIILVLLYHYRMFQHPQWLDDVIGFGWSGVAIAALFAFRPAVKEWCAKRGNQILLLALIALTGAWFLCEEQHSFYASIFGYPVVAAGYGLAIIAAVSPSCILYRAGSRVTELIARLSFALYLSHKGVIHLAQPLLIKTGIAPKGNGMLLACFLTALLGAYALNKIVEAPFLRLRQRVLEQRRKKQYPQPVLVMSETERG